MFSLNFDWFIDLEFSHNWPPPTPTPQHSQSFDFHFHLGKPHSIIGPKYNHSSWTGLCIYGCKGIHLICVCNSRHNWIRPCLATPEGSTKVAEIRVDSFCLQGHISESYLESLHILPSSPAPDLLNALCILTAKLDMLVNSITPHPRLTHTSTDLTLQR